MEAPTLPSEPEDFTPSELRTFLTVDVRGYTRFTQEFGDEAAARLATKFAAVARDVVSRFGGEVIELRGDEALAVFLSARQALRCSVALQKRFAEETAQEPELPLRVGMGLDAGEVVPVESGYRGGALNLAARLSSLAGPGEVLASDAALHLARRVAGLQYVERGLAELKGFAEPVPVLRVVEESEDGDAGAPTNGNGNGNGRREQTGQEALPIGGFLGSLPEGLLVARDEEFDTILGAIQAVESGAGRLVMVSGEPGVGKTRLAQEVTLKLRNHSFLMATGRCYEPEASVPFYPFREALDTLFNVAPPELVAELPRRWPDAQRLLPSQSSAYSASLDEGPEEQQRLFWAVTGFLQAVAEERPVGLLLDDLHWADGSSLELLQHLARHTRASRILLLGTYRDVEINRQHPLEAAVRDLGRERLVEEIELRRLEERGTGELVRAILGGADAAPQFIHLVHHRTDGNPFFVEELVRALVERGDVYRRDGRWEGRSVRDIEVPKSVRSVIGQRLSRLNAESQAILQEASVLGPVFEFEDLLHMCDREEASIEAALELAVSAGLVRETGGDSYAFNHTLTQSTLYGELPSRKRRRLHLAAGKSLEKLPEPMRKRRIAELAWHFLEADEAEPALTYAMAAARSARDLFAYDQAERHYRTALEIARELGDKAQVAKALEGLGGVLRTVGRYEEALPILNEALELHKAAGNVPGERWTTAHIGRIHALRGTAKQGIEIVTTLLSRIEATSPGQGMEGASQAGLAALYTALANLYQETDESSQQLDAAERALELARSADDPAGPRIVAEGQMWRAAALAELGDLEDARRMLEDAVPLAEASGDALTLSRSLNSLAMVYSEAGQYDKERMYMERALEVAERMGVPPRVAFMNHRLGWHLLMLGHYEESRQYLERARSMWQSLRETATGAWTSIALSYLSFLCGEEDEGERYLQEARELEQGQTFPGHVASIAHWMQLDRLLRNGRFEAAREYLASLDAQALSNDWIGGLLLPVQAWTMMETGGDLQAAEELTHQAIESAQLDRNRTVLTEALRVHGMVLARQGRIDEGLDAMQESISTARAIQQPYSQARSLEALAHVEMDAGDIHGAADHAHEAIRIYAELGAVAELERISTMLEQLTFDQQPVAAPS